MKLTAFVLLYDVASDEIRRTGYALSMTAIAAKILFVYGFM